MKLLEVGLKDKSDFLRVAETLRRIGHVSGDTKNLQQSVFILHKTGKYFIMHHSELESLDAGNPNGVPEHSIAVRNTVAHLLQKWNLVSIEKPEWAVEPRSSMKDIIVIPFRDRADWTFTPLYEIGKAKLT